MAWRRTVASNSSNRCGGSAKSRCAAAKRASVQSLATPPGQTGSRIRRPRLSAPATGDPRSTSRGEQSSCSQTPSSTRCSRVSIITAGSEIRCGSPAAGSSATRSSSCRVLRPLCDRDANVAELSPDRAAVRASAAGEAPPASALLAFDEHAAPGVSGISPERVDSLLGQQIRGGCRQGSWPARLAPCRRLAWSSG
jgi:hypothetical protein